MYENFLAGIPVTLTDYSASAFFQCLQDFATHLGSSISTGKIVPQIIHMKTDLLPLICFLFCHDIVDSIRIKQATVVEYFMRTV